MPSSVVKEGLLTESNCAITEEQLNAIIRRGQQITDFYEQEKDCFARGKFAQVRRICHKETGIHYAAKSIKRRRPRCGDVTSEILHEIRVLLTSEHCNRVIDVHEVFETPTEYILVLELAKGGELQQILDEDERIEEKICRRLLRQIVEGVRFLHTHKIAHLDLKPQNILLTNPLPDGNVKLCDFGISRYISESAEIREIMGTTDYMAPEILQYDPISLASDIWCIGIVAYVLLSGHSPFGGNEKQETYSNITSGALEFPDSLFENVSEQAKDFIRRCLIRDPCERMTCNECLEHEWISNDDLKLEIITTSCEEVVVLTNNGVACDGESNKEEVKFDASFTEKCASNISVPTLDKVDFLGLEQPLLLSVKAQQRNDVDQNSCCDTQSGHVNTSNNVEMDISNQPLSYESDKENVEVVDTLAQTAMVNVQETEITEQQPTDQTSNISFSNLNSFYKSHKRLSSDTFPSSDHQKLIAVVASSSASNLSALKKYTSESAMSTVKAANGSQPGDSQQESAQRLVRFSGSNRNDSNNNLMKDHSAPIQVPIVVEASNGTVSVNNSGETSPPSTPNKKIYLSIDDSFCHFGSSSSETSKLMFTKLLPSSILTSPNVTTTTTAVMHSSSTGACSKIRSVSVERLNTCARVDASSASTKAISCFDTKMDQIFSSEPCQNFQFSSSTTISSSSTSSSLSSLVSTINFTRVHQQMSSQVSSPGC